MKKWFIGVAVLVAAGAVVAQTGNALLNTFAKTLRDAEGLNVSYTVTKLGGSSEAYTVNLAKPNMARIESASQTIIADGTKVTFYDKKSNSFYSRTQTPAELRSLLSPEVYNLWSSFFVDGAFAKMNVKAQPDKNRKGTMFKVVTLTPPDSDSTSWTLYINPSDNIVRQAEIVTKGKNEGTQILDCKSVELGKADVFAFKAPAGAKEIDEAELYADRWYTSYDEAAAIAKKTNRIMLIDFYTDWCHWCKELDKNVFPTAEFKAMSKFFVFVKINAEVDVALAKKYSVNAYPTAKIVGPDGNLISEVVGYKETGAYVSDMRAAASKAGLGGN